MLAIDRWRNWRPSDEKYGEDPECEPSKPSKPTFAGFEGSTLAQIQKFSDRPPDEPDARQEEFTVWALERCALRDDWEDSASIACLLLDFAEWCIAHESVPCQRVVFETLLEEAGFRCANGMAAGMVLKVDLEIVLRSQAATRATER